MKDFPLIRSKKAALFSTLLLTVPVLLFSVSPLTAMLSLILIVLIMPAGICCASLTGGSAPAAAGVAAAILSGLIMMGTRGMACVSLYLLPLVAVFVFLHYKKLPFFKSCGIMIAAHVLAFGFVYLYLQQLFGQHLYRAAADGLMSFLAASPDGDAVLLTFYQNGFISLDTKMAEQLKTLLSSGESFFMTMEIELPEDIRHEMLLSLGAFTENMLFNFTLTLFASHSVISGAACLLLPQRFGKALYARQRHFSENGTLPYSFPDLGMLPMSLWHVPRGLGWKLVVMWIAGSLLQIIQAADSVKIAGAILSHFSTAIFTIQGACLLNFIQKAKGSKRVFRILLPVGLHILGALPYLGILDQAINLRGLRKPPEPKEDI